MDEANRAPRCPGCHFGCSLDAYRCARGKGFHDRWQAGEEIPERGKPGGRGPGGPGGPGGGHPAMPTHMRVMHALNIMGNVLQDRHAESPDRKVLASIARQGGFFADSLLPKRAFMERAETDEAVNALVADGLLERAEDPIAGPILRITEAGRARQQEWTAAQESAAADFLAPLTEEEQTQLADLLFRLLKP